MNFFSNLVFFPNEFTEVVNFENCYLGIYPEFFLIPWDCGAPNTRLIVFINSLP